MAKRSVPLTFEASVAVGVLFRVWRRLDACLYSSLSERFGDDGKLRKTSTSFSMLKGSPISVIAAVLIVDVEG